MPIKRYCRLFVMNFIWAVNAPSIRRTFAVDAALEQWWFDNWVQMHLNLLMAVYIYIYMTNWKDAFIVSKIISHTLSYIEFLELDWIYYSRYLSVWQRPWQVKLSFHLCFLFSKMILTVLHSSIIGMLLDRAVENNIVYYITCFIWECKKTIMKSELLVTEWKQIKRSAMCLFFY